MQNFCIAYHGILPNRGKSIIDSLRGNYEKETTFKGHTIGYSDWDNTDLVFLSFLKFFGKGYLPQELLDYHHLNQNDFENINSKNNKVKNDAEKFLVEKLKTNINWDSLKEQMPTDEERSIAIAVKTRLYGLSRKQIDALVKQANWLTELQIRLYLPELLN